MLKVNLNLGLPISPQPELLPQGDLLLHALELVNGVRYIHRIEGLPLFRMISLQLPKQLVLQIDKLVIKSH